MWLQTVKLACLVVAIEILRRTRSKMARKVAIFAKDSPHNTEVLSKCEATLRAYSPTPWLAFSGNVMTVVHTLMRPIARDMGYDREEVDLDDGGQ